MVSHIKYTLRRSLLLIVAFLACNSVTAQFFNVNIKAEIVIEKNSEFYTFKAIAENTTITDYDLRYDFMVFKTDDNGNTAKSSQGDLFFLKGNERTILSSVTINYNVEGKIILVLLIYDKDDKPIGQDRIELGNGGKTKIILENEPEPVVNSDQARPQDGFILNGLIIENTITKAGRDFHRYFTQEIRLSEIKTSKNIVIDEVPGRSRNTRVSVKVDGTLVWQFFAQPRKEFLKKMAVEAFNRSLRHLQRLQQQKEQITRY